MTEWRLPYGPEPDPPKDRWRHLPTPLAGAAWGPDAYIPHDALIDAVNTALALSQPLFQPAAVGDRRAGLR